MQMPGTHAAILERIGRTIADLDEDIANEGIPAPIGALLDHRNECGDFNVFCALAEALTRPEDFEFVERNGELFMTPRDRGAA